MILSLDLHDLQLNFQVLNTPVAKLWVERMQQRQAWPLDDPERFYGFNSKEKDQFIALTKIQECVKRINSWAPIIKKNLESVQDQDTLNYLHNIFEKWHGLLDQHPVHPEYGLIPDTVKQDLAELNISVHRCESAARGNKSRFVCTWFGMPKTKTLPVEYMQDYGTTNPDFGSVCLNYVEIGKPLEDLSQDRDTYISEEAFFPFNYYSADFVVRMYEESPGTVADKISNMHNYYNQHQEFFQARGFTTFYDPRLLPLRFPVAKLIETMPRDQLIKSIAQRQQVTKVTLQ